MLVKTSRTPIEIRVTDRLFNETRVGQMARYTGHSIDLDPENVCRVTVRVQVRLHELLADGTLGVELRGKGFARYNEPLSADNNCLIDAQTQEILEIRSALSDDWDAVIAAYGERPVILQGDAFWTLMDQPVISRDLVVQHITQANESGKFS